MHYNPLVNVEMCIEFLVTTRDKCHVLEDLTHYRLTSNLYRNLLEVRKELEEIKQAIIEEEE